MTGQINLLPDIKQERLREQRKEQLIKLAAIAVIIVMTVAMVVMVTAALLQKRSLVSTQEDISRVRGETESIEEKDDLLGVQTALQELPGLASQKVYLSKMPGVFEQVVPKDVTISNLQYSTDGSLEISGSTSTFRNLYTFIDSLENTEGNVTVDGETSDSVELFQSVQLTGSSPGDSIDFSITAAFSNQVLMLGQEDGGADEIDDGGLDG